MKGNGYSCWVHIDTTQVMEVQKVAAQCSNVNSNGVITEYMKVKKEGERKKQTFHK